LRGRPYKLETLYAACGKRTDREVLIVLGPDLAS